MAATPATPTPKSIYSLLNRKMNKNFTHGEDFSFDFDLEKYDKDLWIPIIEVINDWVDEATDSITDYDVHLEDMDGDCIPPNGTSWLKPQFRFPMNFHCDTLTICFTFTGELEYQEPQSSDTTPLKPRTTGFESILEEGAEAALK